MMSEVVLVLRECLEKRRGGNKAAAAAAAQPRDVGPGEHRAHRRPNQRLLAARRPMRDAAVTHARAGVAVFVSWCMQCMARAIEKGRRRRTMLHAPRGMHCDDGDASRVASRRPAAPSGDGSTLHASSSGGDWRTTRGSQT
jgi:hypothetical protein